MMSTGRTDEHTTVYTVLALWLARCDALFVLFRELYWAEQQLVIELQNNKNYFISTQKN